MIDLSPGMADIARRADGRLVVSHYERSRRSDLSYAEVSMKDCVVEVRRPAAAYIYILAERRVRQGSSRDI